MSGSNLSFDHYEIRSMVAKDAALFFKLVESNRERLGDFFAGTLSQTKTLEDTIAFVNKKLELMEVRKYFPFVMVDTNSSKLIGFIDVKSIDWRIPKVELGCFIDAGYTKQQIAGKALQWVINKMFTEYEMNKLFLRTHETNKPARALAEKCGFEIEGKIRKDHKTTKGEIVDLLYYGLVKC